MTPHVVSPARASPMRCVSERASAPMLVGFRARLKCTSRGRRARRLQAQKGGHSTGALSLNTSARTAATEPSTVDNETGEETNTRGRMVRRRRRQGNGRRGRGCGCCQLWLSPIQPCLHGRVCLCSSVSASFQYKCGLRCMSVCARVRVRVRVRVRACVYVSVCVCVCVCL